MSNSFLEVQSFKKGITDYPLRDDPEYSNALDNLEITYSGKLRVRGGFEALVNARIPSGETSIDGIVEMDGDVLVFSTNKVYLVGVSSFSELGTYRETVPSGVKLTFSKWRGHLLVSSSDNAPVVKIFKNENSVYKILLAGLPVFPASGVSFNLPTGSDFSYLYAIVYRYDYNVGTVSFIDRGEAFFSKVQRGGSGTPISPSNVSVVTLPTSISGNSLRETSSINIEVYRTQNGGANFFLVGSANLGDSSFSDLVADDALIKNKPFYGNNSLPQNGSPPSAKYIHIVNNACYYASTESVDSSFEILQSIPGDIDSVPSNFIEFSESPIRGISSVNNKPIVLTDSYIYRIDGVISSSGSGAMSLVKINENVGCLGNSSVVQTDKGLFWIGKDGIFWSDGFKVSIISTHISKTLNSLIDSDDKKAKISSVYIQEEERVYWSVHNSNNSLHGKTLCLDLRYSSSSHGTFYFFSFPYVAHSLCSLSGSLSIGSDIGTVLKQDSSLSTDTLIESSVAPASWGTSAIIYKYLSPIFNFGTSVYRKLVGRILFSVKREKKISCSISSYNDGNRSSSFLKNLVDKGQFSWGDSLFIWGDSSFKWGSSGTLDQWRRFPSAQYRCQQKQIELSNAFSSIYSNKELGTCSTNSNTVTLDSGLNWFSDLDGYYIQFQESSDRYLIKSQDGNVLTLGSTPPTVSGSSFIISGNIKGSSLDLLGYTISFSLPSNSLKQYSGE